MAIDAPDESATREFGRSIVKAEKPRAEMPAAAVQDPASPANGGGIMPGGEAVGVDKIRDLLFGNQMQDYDRRFSKLEERFLQRFKDIETETAQNLSAYESNAKKLIESLATQFREEESLRADADKEIERVLREQTQALEKRMRTMSDQLGQLERDMADRITREAQTLREETKQKNADLRVMIENMFAELSNVKTDRNLLAGLFLEVARCLNQDNGAKSAGKGIAVEPVRSFTAN
jgi:flagellar biosynthesis GTPase FlhF